MYTHCQHTFKFRQLVKVHVALYDPFNKKYSNIFFTRIKLKYNNNIYKNIKIKSLNNVMKIRNVALLAN